MVMGLFYQIADIVGKTLPDGFSGDVQRQSIPMRFS